MNNSVWYRRPFTIRTKRYGNKAQNIKARSLVPCGKKISITAQLWYDSGRSDAPDFHFIHNLASNQPQQTKIHCYCHPKLSHLLQLIANHESSNLIRLRLSSRHRGTRFWLCSSIHTPRSTSTQYWHCLTITTTNVIGRPPHLRGHVPSTNEQCLVMCPL